MSIAKTNDFLIGHQLRAEDFNLEDLVKSYLEHMEKGLSKVPASLLMLPTFIEAENDFLLEKKVIAIDAGGTNFRTALMHFSKEGELMIEQLESHKMPGVEEEITKEEFFKQMAYHLEPYAEHADKIGFCFSYAVEVSPNKDGRLLYFTKEIKAPEVEGEMIGENLLEAMGTPEKQVVILNDTVSTLLAGKSASTQKQYDSYIGFILGTGTNTSYIEQNSNIIKTEGLDLTKSQIINMESGNFSSVHRTDIDIAFDNETSDPGSYTFEKMIAGGYLGGLCLKALKAAADEALFSERTAELIHKIETLTTEEANNFTLGVAEAGNPLKEAVSTAEDAESIVLIIDTLIERAAKLSAGSIAAIILKTGKGKQEQKPVLITIEGTTFYKMKGLQFQFEAYLEEFLSGENQRYFELAEVDQSSLVGAALAALVN